MMIFQGDRTELSECMHSLENTVMLTPGISNLFRIAVVNDSNLDITILEAATGGVL